MNPVRNLLIVMAIVTAGCVPPVSIIEGAKQLGSYASREYLDEEDRFLKNYTDKEVCLAATNIAGGWDDKNAALPFVREAKRRKMDEGCREKYRAAMVKPEIEHEAKAGNADAPQ